MIIDVLTLFPEMFDDFLSSSIIGRAVTDNLVIVNVSDIRKFSANKHKKVDDYPYGGGPGMLMAPQPLDDAIKSVNTDNSAHIVYLSPQGTLFNQSKVRDLSKYEHLVLLCGHYEGIDQRIIDSLVDEELSIGDFVLTGGELPAMIVIDAITRTIPGVLSSDSSFEQESHYDGLLEHPQYTRPYDYNGMCVPEILISGNHEKIADYNLRQAIRNTVLKRPDLINLDSFDDKKLKIYHEIINDIDKIE